MLDMNKKKYNFWGWLDNIFSLKWIILGVILYTYGAFRKQDLYVYSMDTNLLINQWDIIFAFFGNIYINIYIVLPYTIFMSISIILSQHHYEKMIRLKSYKNWIYDTWKSFIKDFTLMYAIWMIICLILLIKTPFSKGWSAFSKSQFYFSETQVLQNYTSSPLWALFLTLVMVMICLSCLHLILTLVFILTQRKWMMISTGVITWIAFGATMKMLPQEAYAFKLSNYLVLHAALSDFKNGWLPFLILFMTLLMSLIVILRIDLKNSIFQRSL